MKRKICQKCGEEIRGIVHDFAEYKYLHPYCYRKMMREFCDDVRVLHKPDKDCDTIEKMFAECGRPIKFSDVFTTELDCVATNQCQSKTPNIKKI
jgi:hypothetical protein